MLQKLALPLRDALVSLCGDGRSSTESVEIRGHIMDNGVLTGVLDDVLRAIEGPRALDLHARAVELGQRSRNAGAVLRRTFFAGSGRTSRVSSSHSSSGPHHAASVFPVPVAA